MSELQWWIHNVPHTCAPISRGNPTDVLFTDSSKGSWGSFFNGVKARGHFTPQEAANIIAVKELFAAFFGFKSFLRHFSGSHVLIRSDSIAAVAYIRDMGGMKNTLIRASSVAPPRLVSKSAFFYSSPRKQKKTAANVMAHKLLCRSGNNVLKINSQFHGLFATPPPRVKRKVLKTGKRVVIPQSPVKQFPHTHKKPYVLYVKLVPEDVVPSTSCNSKKPHDDSSTK